MKFLDEYRDAAAAEQFAEAIRQITIRSWTIMEVCGGQTHTIVKYAIDDLLPREITLLHGPGCPVCVTPMEIIDQAIQIAARPEVIFCSFGDMLRVPGRRKDLFSVKSEGGDVRIVYSPMDSLSLARQNPDREVVFFAVGFETTAPANAMAVYQAKRRRDSQLLDSCFPCTCSTCSESHSCLSADEGSGISCRRPCLHCDGLHGIRAHCSGISCSDCGHRLRAGGHSAGDLPLHQTAGGRSGEVENQYVRSVTRQGNELAQKIIREVFQIVPRKWRGVGTIAGSGLGLSDAYAHFDAVKRFKPVTTEKINPRSASVG